MRRRNTLFAFLIYEGAIGSAMVPLIPALAATFNLSRVGTGVLVATPNVAVLVAAVPCGLAADKFGARAVTRSAGMLFAVSAVGLAFASSYALVLASWAGIGVAQAAVVTATIS